MRFWVPVLLLALAIGGSQKNVAIIPNTQIKNPGFVSSLVGKPTDWTGSENDLFSANYNYPSSLQDISEMDWLKIDPRDGKQRSKYYDAVLSYALTAFQGDIQAGCKKTASDWFHVPWMTFSFGASIDQIYSGQVGSGREPICGLTQERPAPPGFLHANQKRSVQNWAVSVFNNPGGYLLGRIWKNRDAVDLTETKFANGTFVIKCLFTEATDQEVPYLLGAPVWNANIYAQEGSTDVRQTKPMRLVQVDFGVRDKRMDGQTGWVYGAFLYYNAKSTVDSDWQKNLIPVGLMWGNDPGVTDPAKYREQVLNPLVTQLRGEGKLFDLRVRQHFGWLDRVNGPIDNPVSSCLSCHSTAQVHKEKAIKHFLTATLTPSASTDANRMLWFRNIKAGQTFTYTAEELKLIDQGALNSARADWTPSLMTDFVSTDYSLQLRVAIERARSFAIQSSSSETQFKNNPALQKDMKKEFMRVERAGTKP